MLHLLALHFSLHKQMSRQPRVRHNSGPKLPPNACTRSIIWNGTAATTRSSLLLLQLLTTSSVCSVNIHVVEAAAAAPNTVVVSTDFRGRPLLACTHTRTHTPVSAGKRALEAEAGEEERGVYSAGQGLARQLLLLPRRAMTRRWTSRLYARTQELVVTKTRTHLLPDGGGIWAAEIQRG